MPPTSTSWLAAVRMALRGAPEGGELVVSSTAERTVIELRSPEGTLCTATIRQRVAPVVPATQLALPMPPAPRELVAPAAVVDELVELVGPDGWEPTREEEQCVPDADIAVAWTWTDEAETAMRTVVPASIAAHVVAHLAEIRVPVTQRPPTVASHLLRVGAVVETVGSPATVLGYVTTPAGRVSTGAVLLVDGMERVAWLDSAALRDGVLRLYVNPGYTVSREDGWWVATLAPVAARSKPAAKAPAKKSTPGSKYKLHRLNDIAEADDLAEHGLAVAVALQPDGHWKRWATNPAEETGLQLTSAAWKTRWSRATGNGLRVRLYNRGGRCTHDSLDGDIGGES